jgi:hypothetical protein
MLFRMFFLAALAVGLVASGPVRAAIVGDASVAYSATRIVTVNGKVYQGKVFHTPGRQRHDVDINGIPASFILDVTRGTGAIVLPALNSYVDFPLPPLLNEFDRHRLDRKAVGDERVAGLRATKYRLDYTVSDGTRAEGFIWLTRDNILLRLSGRILRPHHKPMIVSMNLSNLRLGPQDPKLFRVGNGLHKIPYQALELLLNLREHRNRDDSP